MGIADNGNNNENKTREKMYLKGLRGHEKVKTRRRRGGGGRSREDRGGRGGVGT